MDMTMASATPATSSMMSQSTSSSSMKGMDMGMGMGGNSCKISMLWNWYTVDACFISSTWHVRSRAAFAGSCVGVILLVLSLEMVRRGEREFDRYLLRQRNTPLLESIESEDHNGTRGSGGSKTAMLATVRERVTGSSLSVRVKWWQHGIRSLLYMIQFAVGYMVMLLAMYYNGYIIIMILVGAFFGALAFRWDTLGKANDDEQSQACC